jgi:hypothetical protein
MNYASDYTKSDEKARHIMPEGTHLGKIFAVVDVGSHPKTFEGITKESRTIKVGFEFPPETTGGRPVTKWMDYGASMYATSKLRQLVENVIAKPLYNTEAGEFKIETIVGRFVSVVFTHSVSKKNGETYSNISRVFPTTSTFNSQVAEYSWCVDEDETASLPEWLARIAMQSKEFKRKTGGNLSQPAFAMGQQVKGSEVDFTPPPPAPAPPAPAKDPNVAMTFGF